MRKIATLILWTGFIAGSFAQPQTSYLDSLIAEGLQNNRSLQQANYQYMKSVAALNEAKGMFLPNVSLNARYSVANGGRTIDLPLNTIFSGYSLINNMANPGLHLITPSQFQDETVKFLRPHEQETKIELAQPLFNPQIYYNQKIKKELSGSALLDVETRERTLVADIKKAYYGYLKSLQIQQVIEDTRKLANENLRVNESLYKNNKVTLDRVCRSQAELSKTEQLLTEAKKARTMASSYLNFLLGRGLDSPVLTDSLNLSLSSCSDLAGAIHAALSNRPEIEKVARLEHAGKLNRSLNRSSRLPNMFAVVDYGFQGEHYQFNHESNYLLASVLLRWDLFKGFQNQSRIDQSEFDRLTASSLLEELQQQVQLEVTQAWYQVKAAAEAILAANDELAAAKKYFDLANKSYAEGQFSLIEYLDARTQWTNSAINVATRKCDYYISLAELERVMASYPLSSVKQPNF